MRKERQWLFVPMVCVLFFTSCTDNETNSPQKHVSQNIDTLLLQNPDSVELLIKRGNKRMEKKEFLLALEDGAKAFRLDSNNVEARLLYALSQNNKASRSSVDVANAQRNLHEVLKIDTNNTKALVALASTYGHQQNFEEAFQYVNDALRIDKKYRDAYVLKSNLFLMTGNVKLAKSSMETAVQQDPNFFEGHLRLGEIYKAEDDPIALEYYTTAYELRPDITKLLYSLAFAKQHFERIEEAQEDYRKMVATDTSDYYISRGLFHQGYIQQFNLNDLDSAVYFYSSAVKTLPKYPEALHNIGLCYETKGDDAMALKYYAKALKVNPQFTLSKEAAERLQ